MCVRVGEPHTAAVVLCRHPHNAIVHSLAWSRRISAQQSILHRHNMLGLICISAAHGVVMTHGIHRPVMQRPLMMRPESRSLLYGIHAQVKEPSAKSGGFMARVKEIKHCPG